MNPICKACGWRIVEDARVRYMTPVCFACIPLHEPELLPEELWVTKAIHWQPHYDGELRSPGWYFYSPATWVQSYGPFGTREEAREALMSYADNLGGWSTPDNL